jgi:hypothetical protein
MSLLQGYKSGEGWYVITDAWEGDEFPEDVRGAMRLVDGAGNVIQRNRAAEYVEEAVKALTAKRKASDKKSMSDREIDDIKIIISAAYFSIVMVERMRNNPVSTVSVVDGDWETAFAIARAVQKRHGRALMYAVRQGGRTACVEAHITISHIVKWLKSKETGTCLST